MWERTDRKLLPQAQPQHRCVHAFLGIDGAGRAAIEAGWPWSVVNGIDSSPAVQAPLYRLHGDDDSAMSCVDISKISLKDLAASDGFIGTAPCQDFSSLTADAPGLAGARGKLFYTQLTMIKHLAERATRPLRWAVMETVAGFMHEKLGGSALAHVQDWWKLHMPSWIPLIIWKVNLLYASSSCSRWRCVLVSFPRDIIMIVGRLPTPPPRHDPVDLVDPTKRKINEKIYIIIFPSYRICRRSLKIGDLSTFEWGFTWDLRWGTFVRELSLGIFRL